MRSLLFVPGDSDRKQARALEAGADALILDLEDSVAPDAKVAARAQVKAFLDMAHATAGPKPALYVRVNALTTDLWQDDVIAVLAGKPDGIMLPKPASGDDVHRLSITIGTAEDHFSIASGSTRILPIVTEIAASLMAMPSYIGSSSRLSAFAWGGEDLAADLGATTDRDAFGRLTSPFALARDLTLYTAIAAGVQAVDTVFVDFRDLEGLASEARIAARDGFTAKLAIHPTQVSFINEAFTPTPAAIEHAQAIVDMFSKNTSSGVISLAGRMYDRPHLLRAERLLKRAAMYGLVPPSA
jgi:citrate lyase subunit beta/citryl-CoA lyase